MKTNGVRYAALSLVLISLLPEAATPAGQRLMPVSLSLSPALTAEAARKIDPRILSVLAQPEKTARALRPAGRRIVLLEESPGEISFPVLIQSDLTDADLAALGAAPDSRAGDIVTARVRAKDLEIVAANPEVRAIEASYRLDPLLDVSVPEVRADLVNEGEPPASYTGQGVLYGLMDTGIDITHADFQDAQGDSRVLYGTGNAPAGFGYGREYTKAQIDAGQASAFIDEGGHGSHVAGISIGDGSSRPDLKYRGIAWNAEVIAVRNGYCDMFCYGEVNPMYDYNQDTKGSVDGLNYMLQKKAQLGRPLVVNQSQGVTMGPHDGTTLFEQAYDQLIDQQGLIICIAAGNDQQSDWHGKKTVSPGGSADFTVTKDNSQQADDWLSFEAWNAAGDAFRWQLVTPSGWQLEVPAAYSPPNEYGQVVTAHSDTLQYWSTDSYSTNGQGHVAFYMWNRRLGVEGGGWTLRALADNALPAGGQVDLYCERNQYTVAVTGDGLSLESIVGMPGTTSGAITVASYNTKDEWDSMSGHTVRDGYPFGEISRFSSWGPRRDGIQKPDLAAPGAFIMSAFAAGSSATDQSRDPDGKHVAFAGTSMATPHVAGAVALMLQKNPALTPVQVKTILRETARADQDTGTVPNEAFGYGKLDVKAAVDAVEGGTAACATRAGDATGDNAVNILDVVRTVNDILLIDPLDEGGRACANMNGDAQIDITDVVAIVNVILGGGLARNAGWAATGTGSSSGTDSGADRWATPETGADAAAEPIAWRLEAKDGMIRLSLDAARVAGVQTSLILPRGFACAGEARLVGAEPGSRVACGGRAGVEVLAAWHPEARPLRDGPGRVTIEVPVRQDWDGGQRLADLQVAAIVLSDPAGRALRPGDRSALEDLTMAPAARTVLAGASPNPMRGLSRIAYDLAHNGEVRLTIHDMGGRRVRTLLRGWQMAGAHSFSWDGTDEDGREVPAGAYFVRLEGRDSGAARKILVVR